MSGKIHRCDEEPLLMTIGWNGRLKRWTLFTSAFNDETYFMFDTKITYCPYCGAKLKEPEEDD